MQDAGNTTVASNQSTPPLTFLGAKLVKISVKIGDIFIPIMLAQNLTINISKMIQPFYPIGQQEPEFSSGPHIINISMGRVMTLESSLLNILSGNSPIISEESTMNRFDTSALGKSLELTIQILEPAEKEPSVMETYVVQGCLIESYGTSISAGEFVLLENVSMLAKNITKSS